MRLIKPEYFDSFRCIASACTRSCCVGWEICIDEISVQKYRSMSGEGDSFILDKISTDEPRFLQDAEERCRMLDEQGLCEIIKRYGNGMLCEICREHPRYYNVLPDRIEGGLGLCCITAAEAILTMNMPPIYTEGQTDADLEEENDEVYNFTLMVRELIEKMLSLEEYVAKVEERIRKIAHLADELAFDVAVGISTPLEAFSTLVKKEAEPFRHFPLFPVSLLGIEVLPRHAEGWEDFIYAASHPQEGEYQSELYRKAHRRLIYYFMHRYFVKGAETMSLSPRLMLALSLSRLILDTCLLRGALTIHEIASIASEFSESFEYSEDNVALFISRIEEQNEA